jgi:hypothetical protein
MKLRYYGNSFHLWALMSIHGYSSSLKGRIDKQTGDIALKTYAGRIEEMVKASRSELPHYDGGSYSKFLLIKTTVIHPFTTSPCHRR